MIAVALVLCFCTLIQSLPIANPKSDSVLIDYKADSHTRYEEGTPGKSVSGSYSWISENKVYQVDYTADENGYRPHLTIKAVSEAEQKPIVQVPALLNEEATPVKETDALIFDIPLRDEPKPVVQNEEGLEDAIVLDIPVQDEPSPIVENNSQSKPIEVPPGTLIGDLFALLNDSPQSETGEMLPSKVVVEEAMKIPVATAPVVQQDDISPQQVVEELKPDKLVVAQEIVVEAPVQSDPVAQEDKSQVQLSSQDEPSVLEQEKVIANDAFVMEIPQVSDLNAQEEAYSQDDAVKPDFDTSEIFSPPVFNFQNQQEPADDGIYTDDAVIIDAAGDPFSSESTLEGGNQDWGKADSQDEASVYLNAMLQEYLNQFFGNSKQQVDIEEDRRSKIGDAKSDPFYYNQEVPENDDVSTIVDYQRMSPEHFSNDGEYVISLDDLYEYFQQLQVANQDRARSKVDDSIQDQGQINEELEAARVVMDLTENYNQQPYYPKKQNSKFESDNQSDDYAIDESLMGELYYQQWLNAQLAPQQETMYYAIYPKSAYYYR